MPPGEAFLTTPISFNGALIIAKTQDVSYRFLRLGVLVSTASGQSIIGLCPDVIPFFLENLTPLSTISIVTLTPHKGVLFSVPP
jgi:hypothetical protein